MRKAMRIRFKAALLVMLGTGCNSLWDPFLLSRDEQIPDLAAMAVQRCKTAAVPLQDGDFFISLEPLVGDPMASITFTIAAAGVQSYRVSMLRITAGSLSGLRIKHPRFIFTSMQGDLPEPSDAFSTVDLTVAASTTESIGIGAARFTGLPATVSHIALGCESIEKVDPTPSPQPIRCKSSATFFSAVMPTLRSCAALCHSPAGTDAQRTASATGAFNMAAANGGDMEAQEQLCVSALARTNRADPPRSVLIRQPLSVALGGTPNHPYKIPDASAPMFQTAVTNWVMQE